MKRKTVWLLAAAIGTCAPAPVLFANPADETVTIRVGTLPYIRTVDERFQSYQIGFSHLTGGETWKAFDALGGQPGKSIADVREPRAPTDLANRRLRNLTAALAPFYLRYSGTTANNVYFQDDDRPLASPPSGYKAVLTRQRWRDALNFAEKVNAKVVTSFTISAGVRDADHNWTPAMAAPWMAYTRSIGREIYAAELYNEPNAPEYPELPKGYSVEQFGRDYATFAAFMPKAAPNVKLAGPGNATLGIPGVEAIMKPSPEDYAKAEPKPRFDIFSYHFYPVLSQRCAPANSPQSIPVDKALGPEFLARPDRQFQTIKGLRDQYAPGAPIWLTETGGAACGGLQWQPTFLDMARYLDTQARLAKQGLDAIFTHALISGSNGVIDEKTFQPNASYWGAVLWRRLMGTRILDAGPQRAGLHLYAHCLRGVPGGVSLLAINLEGKEKRLRLSGPAALYSLTAREPLSRTVLLNGRELAVTPEDTLPPMEPVRFKGHGIVLPPLGNAFIALPKAHNPACRNSERSL
jgi:heparanase